MRSNSAATASSRRRSSSVARKSISSSGKVDGRLHVHAERRHLLVEPEDRGGELAGQGPVRGPGRGAGTRVDEIRHRFGLQQVQLVVEEGPLGELAGTRQPGAEPDDPRHQHVQQHRTAVGVQLEHVLAGEGMGRGKEQREAGIERLAVRVAKTVERGDARLRAAAEHRARQWRGPAGPEMRTMPTPPRPAGVARATMVVPGIAVHGTRHDTAAQSAPSTLLMRHCWAIDSTELVSQ